MYAHTDQHSAMYIVTTGCVQSVRVPAAHSVDVQAYMYLSLYWYWNVDVNHVN